jgi:hypothetical protein
VNIKSRKNFGEFIRFSRRFEALLKFTKDSNVESGPGFLALLCWELDVGTIEKIVHNIPI